mgnify:FL=1|tara:strand:+ start:714 stop:1019 length:306 start_codon:yes stop_codon:yes gene_type:complete
MNQEKNKQDIKIFLVKLVAICLAAIVVINITFNLIFAKPLEDINKLLSINDKENVDIVKNKIRKEIKKGLSKEKILSKKDRVLLYKFYLKVKKEFEEVELN